VEGQFNKTKTIDTTYSYDHIPDSLNGVNIVLYFCCIMIITRKISAINSLIHDFFFPFSHALRNCIVINIYYNGWEFSRNENVTKIKHIHINDTTKTIMQRATRVESSIGSDCKACFPVTRFFTYTCMHARKIEIDFNVLASTQSHE
jgi:hypothetical protein